MKDSSRTAKVSNVSLVSILRSVFVTVHHLETGRRLFEEPSNLYKFSITYSAAANVDDRYDLDDVCDALHDEEMNAVLSFVDHLIILRSYITFSLFSLLLILSY